MPNLLTTIIPSFKEGGLTLTFWASSSVLLIHLDIRGLVLSRLRSGLSTHLCGLSLKCQGAFAAER